LLFLFLFSILIFAEEESLYEDISDEHWAYRDIKFLNKSGVFETEEKIFNGDEILTRFEFAHYLSKALHHINADKASRSDIYILENIVYEFSQELNKIGFDAKVYIETLDDLQKRVTQNEINAKKNEEILNDINLRLKELEQTSSKSQQYIDRTSLYSDRLKYFENFHLFLESGISYSANSADDTVEDDTYKGNYTLGMGFTEDNFELIIESETSDVTDTFGELVVRGQLATEVDIMGGSTLSYHTRGYEKYYRSHFNHLIYDNHSSYQYVKVTDPDTDYVRTEIGDQVAYYEPQNGEITFEEDEFNSYGLGFENENLVLLVEKTANVDSSYVENGLTNASGNRAYLDTITFFAQGNTDYFEGTFMTNGNNDNSDYQLVGKYPSQAFDATAGLYLSVRDSEDTVQDYSGYEDMKVYDFQLEFGDFREFSLGLERKEEEIALYNDYYATVRYLLTGVGVIKYKLENVRTYSKDSLFNHHFLLNFTRNRLKTYLSYNIVDLDKDAVVNEDSLSEEYYLVNGVRTRIKEYNEFLIKAEYEFNEKLQGILGYYTKDYSLDSAETSSSDLTQAEEVIVFFQFSFNLAENINTYLRYLENNAEEKSDRILDINNDMIDIDFNGSTGVIREAADGIVEIGVEIKF
jgi:hypothetical protein